MPPAGQAVTKPSPPAASTVRLNATAVTSLDGTPTTPVKSTVSVWPGPTNPDGAAGVRVSKTRSGASGVNADAPTGGSSAAPGSQSEIVLSSNR